MSIRQAGKEIIIYFVIVWLLFVLSMRWSRVSVKTCFSDIFFCSNLHPTEAYLLLPAVPGMCAIFFVLRNAAFFEFMLKRDFFCSYLGLNSGVYHYAPRTHKLELRSQFANDNNDSNISPNPSNINNSSSNDNNSSAVAWKQLTENVPAEMAENVFFFALSSIHWRGKVAGLGRKNEERKETLQSVCRVVEVWRKSISLLSPRCRTCTSSTLLQRCNARLVCSY